MATSPTLNRLPSVVWMMTVSPGSRGFFLTAPANVPDVGASSKAKSSKEGSPMISYRVLLEVGTNLRPVRVVPLH